MYDSLRIKAYSRPFSNEHNLRQAYFWESLRGSLTNHKGQFERIPVTSCPTLLSFLGKLKDSYKFQWMIQNNKKINSIIHLLASHLEGKLLTPSECFQTSVGQYVIEFKKQKNLRFCIDMSDAKGIASLDLLNWSDLYFKANYWKDETYSPKVEPVYYVNPYVLNNIEKLKQYRNLPKTYDLCFIVRVYGGTNETEGIEHNLRLIEEISKLNCNKYLYACLVSGNINQYRKRLESQGIPCGNQSLPIEDLWRISGQSRITFMRLGMHFCIPWRMTDMLAIGASPVFDSTPYSIWPMRLTEMENFLSLGLKWSHDKMLALDEEYRQIPRKIEEWLNNGALLQLISDNNHRYFDDYLMPKNLGRYMIDTLLRHSNS